MSPGHGKTTMSDVTLSSNSNSQNLTVPKLRDDGSNWADYEPRVMTAMKAKGIWKHVLGTAYEPKPYTQVNNVTVLSDGKTPASEEQIMEREEKIDEYDRKQNTARHVILSTTSIRLGAKVKNLKTAKEMWEEVKKDATTNTLFIIDAEDELSNMKCQESSDAKIHLTEITAHFNLMVQRKENLIQMGSSISDTRFNAIIMASLPASYRPAKQTISAAERTSKTPMASSDLIAFFTEEARNRYLEDQRANQAESALSAHGSKQKKRSGQKDGKKAEKCENCGRTNHIKANCYQKGGGKEGQAPWMKKDKKKEEKKSEESANIAQDEDIFAFTCTSDFTAVAGALRIPKSRCGAIADSGASRHFSPDKSKFTNYRPLENRHVTTADGRTFRALGMGDIEIDLPNGASYSTVILKDSVYAPDLTFTLISISRLDLAKCGALFKDGKCTISYPDGRTMATLPLFNGLYRLVAEKAAKTLDHAQLATTKMSINEAHRKFGHIAHAAIKHMVKTGMVTGLELDPDSKPEFCEPCAKSKSNRQPFPKESTTRATKYGERVHWDLWGPATVQSLAGHSYVAARMDDATREMKLYFQKKKSETITSYKKDEAYIKMQTGHGIKYSRSDRGGEFLSKALTEHQDIQGTQRELTVHDSPQQNGVSERGMRTRAEQARALLIGSGLPRALWAEAMMHSAWLQNRSATRALDGKTPYEARNGKKPNLAGIQEFGAAAYVKDLAAGKLDSRAQIGRFVGYDSESKGYRIYWPHKHSVTVERNVVFNEDDILVKNDHVVISGDVLAEGERDKVIQHPLNTPKPENDQPEPQPESNENLPENQELPSNSIPFPQRAIHRPEIDLQVEPNTGRGHRTRHVPGHYARLNKGLETNFAVVEFESDEEVENAPEEALFAVDGDLYVPPLEDYALGTSLGNEPKTLDEALCIPHAKQWQAAYDYEIAQLQKLGTWELVKLPPGKIPIPHSLVFREKLDADGNIDSWRVRLVAGGHRQTYGVDYDETFATAAKMPSIRVVLANAAQQDWEMHQVDVKSAYLNAPLDEEVYMFPPVGILKPGQERMVCKLKKALYGLKQAGREWQKTLSVHRQTWVPQIRSRSLNFLSTERRGANDNCGGHRRHGSDVKACLGYYEI